MTAPGVVMQKGSGDVMDWQQWAEAAGVQTSKLEVRAPLAEERGKGGVFASEAIAPMEVIARIPRQLVLTESSEFTSMSWASALTASALMATQADGSADEIVETQRAWIESWTDGGWATDASDLGNDEVRWGGRDVTGSLLATGSDNDKNIYAKFRFPCHPVVHRASLGLAALTGASNKDAMAALVNRGFAFRAMRDALIPLVATPSERPKGSLRDKRSWDVADMLSRVLSRATTLQLDRDGEAATSAVVPLHERLEHADARGENAKLVGLDPTGGEKVLLVATRAIEAGEAIPRDYAAAPRLPDDASEGSLRLLLQFGLPPTAWSTPDSKLS